MFPPGSGVPTAAQPDLGPLTDDRSGSRRWLLRSGALAAGVAVATVAVPTTANAADGDPLELGAELQAEATTTLSVGAEDGSAQPTLTLQNANGPSLKLQPLPGHWSV